MGFIKDIFTDVNFLSAIITTIVFILLGFFLRRRNIIKEGSTKTLNAIVMNIAIPCMAFVAFMNDFDLKEFKNNIMALVFSFVFYLILLILGEVIFIKKPKKQRKVYSIFVSIGQLTFFSIPMLSAIYSDNLSKVIIPASLMTLSFRFFLYFYSYISINDLKFNKETLRPTIKKIFLNPIMIMMFLGLFIYLSQSFMFKVNIKETVNGESITTAYSILRIDKTLKPLYSVLSYGNKMSTPVCMLLIGATLGECDLKRAFINKMAYLIAGLRVLGAPLLVLGLLSIIHFTGLYTLNEYLMATLVIGFGAPLSAVVISFCIDADNEAYMASDACFLSTLMSVITIPISLILVKACFL